MQDMQLHWTLYLSTTQLTVLMRGYKSLAGLSQNQERLHISHAFPISQHPILLQEGCVWKMVLGRSLTLQTALEVGRKSIFKILL